MHSYRGLAVYIFTSPDFTDPATPNHDANAMVFEVAPAQPQSLADCEAGSSNDQRENEHLLNTLDLVELRISAQYVCHKYAEVRNGRHREACS